MKTRSLTLSLALVTACAGFPSLLIAGDDSGILKVVQGGDDPNVGIKYDKNKGLFVTDISAKIIGLKMAEVEEKPLPSGIRLVAQVYDTAPAGKALASAWASEADAGIVKTGTPVKAPGGRTGTVSDVSTLTVSVNQKAEILLEVEDPEDKLVVGQFLEVTAERPAGGDVVVVPKSAVLKTSEGTFAYADNSGWKFRTAITTGAEHDGLVEVTDGLFSGDSVVAHPVMTLWMTELQLTKSGKA